ncbi:MAG: O-antigen ligase family protein [Verrucomicrobiota bacterium]|jgi:hypothetical protein
MFNRYKILAAYLLAIPLALILGILAASPNELTFMLIGMLLFFLALPVFIKWHHFFLLISWNSAFSAFFLPGEPTFWLLFAGLSFGLSGLDHVMGRRPFPAVPEMTRPLLLMAAVVIGTACYRGGVGTRLLGGAAHGGKNYIYCLGAILGYFALTAGQIPVLKSQKMAGLFFLSGATNALSNLAYFLGPAFYFFYYLVPVSTVGGQVASDFGLTDIDRIQGLGLTGLAGMCFLLTRYGIQGLFDWTKPWRFVFLCLVFVMSCFAGFRSALVLFLLVFAFQFYFEGMLRTRLFPVVVGLAVVGFVSLMFCADRLPLSVQRSVSFLPVNVDSEVRADATGSIDWRLEIWSVVWKDAPKYLVVGKGYSFDATEMESTLEAIQLGLLNNSEEQILAGSYHNGPLSVLIPFGIIGSVAFLWVLAAGFRVLYSNLRYGDARLKRINCVLLSCYLARCFCFVFIFGALNTDLYLFLGLVGLSVSLNGGAKRKPGSGLEYARESMSQSYAMEVK